MAPKGSKLGAGENFQCIREGTAKPTRGRGTAYKPSRERGTLGGNGVDKRDAERIVQRLSQRQWERDVTRSISSKSERVLEEEEVQGGFQGGKSSGKNAGMGKHFLSKWTSIRGERQESTPRGIPLSVPEGLRSKSGGSLTVW